MARPVLVKKINHPATPRGMTKQFCPHHKGAGPCMVSTTEPATDQAPHFCVGTDYPNCRTGEKCFFQHSV